MTEAIAPNSNEVYLLNNKEYPVILWILLYHYMSVLYVAFLDIAYS